MIYKIHQVPKFLYTEESCKFSITKVDANRYIKLYLCKTPSKIHKVFLKLKNKLPSDIIDFYYDKMKKYGKNIIVLIIGYKNDTIYKLYMYDRVKEIHYGKETNVLIEREYINTECNEQTFGKYPHIFIDLFPEVYDTSDGCIRYDNGKEIAFHLNTAHLNLKIGENKERIRKYLISHNCYSDYFENWVENNKHKTITYFGVYVDGSFTVYYSDHSYFKSIN